MQFTVEKANKFIREKKQRVNQKYYPKYHFAPPIGWMNDPNGVSRFNEEYHLFYQHYPYEAKHGPMHWGHAKSKDGLNWEHLPIALAPDQIYDQGGCFSGSAIEKEGKLYLMYTGHLPDEQDSSRTRQNQNIAISEDGITFKKFEGNPVLTEKDIPEGSSVQDFRDPKVFEKAGEYYCVIGSKTNDNKGQVLLYHSPDLLNWKYVSTVFPHNNYLGSMAECPDLLLFEENKAIFFISAMEYTDEQGNFYPHITWMIEGKMDFDHYVFKQTSIKQMDKGFDFYAPQSVKINDNEYWTMTWMQNWSGKKPPMEENHHWIGQMTLPRIISYENGSLKQKIQSSIYDQVTVTHEEENIVFSDKKVFRDTVDFMSFKITPENLEEFGVTLKNELDENISFHYSKVENGLFFSREQTHSPIQTKDGESINRTSMLSVALDKPLEVRVFIDTSSIELFVNEEESLTSTFYVNQPFTLMEFETKKTIKLDTLKIGQITV